MPTAMILSPLFLWWLWIVPRLYAKHLRKLMVEHGVEICIKCGYDLHGLTEPRCPECGTPFDEQLPKKNA